MNLAGDFGEREGDAEGGAVAEAGGFGPDAAAVLADGVAGDGEAEAGAGAAAGWVGLVEAFEDTVEFVEGEAGAGVGDADDRIVAAPVRGDADGAAGRRELDGVVDEAHDDAGGAVGVGVDGERVAVGGNFEGDLVAGRLGAEAVGGRRRPD